MTLEELFKAHPRPWRVDDDDFYPIIIIDANGESIGEGETVKAINSIPKGGEA